MSSESDHDFDALYAEVLADNIAGAALCENDFRRTLSVAFEAARKRKGLSIRHLANKIGTSVSQVQRLLHEEVADTVTLRTVFRAAHILELSVSAHVREKTTEGCGDVLRFPTVAWTTGGGARSVVSERGQPWTEVARLNDAQAGSQWNNRPTENHPSLRACGGTSS